MQRRQIPTFTFKLSDLKEYEIAKQERLAAKAASMEEKSAKTGDGTLDQQNAGSSQKSQET
ncbi:Dyak\GE13231-PA-like protein [Anopheles sinensis]|uniref:Dyak\GE13231-PA-like protein n=1 Tax=Anopheles sinensis TaxID=74873 RepID=A0A084WQU8_ANOSI|nr:Dyak\GE13231-PA-like protein [Anopheles sinensis]